MGTSTTLCVGGRGLSPGNKQMVLIVGPGTMGEATAQASARQRFNL